MADVKSTVTELDEIRSRKSKKRADKNDQEKRADEAHAFTVQATFHRKRVNYFGRPFRTKDDFGINTTTISHYSQFGLDIFGDIRFEITNLVHPNKLFIPNQQSIFLSFHLVHCGLLDNISSCSRNKLMSCSIRRYTNVNIKCS